MRKPLGVILGLLVVVCVCGCGVSTRGAERHVRAVNVQTTAGSSSAAVLLASRTPGALVIAGPTQGSLTPLATRAYRAAGGSDTVAIRNTGADTAFSELCTGQIDMVGSVAPMSRTALAQCEKAGIRPVQLEVASDAIVLATKAETDVGADCVSVAALKSIIRAGSPVFNWGQLGFDQIPLSVAGPGPGTNGFGFIANYVLGTPQASGLDLRSDYHGKSSGRPVVQFVAGRPSDSVAASQLIQMRQRVSTLSAVFAGARQSLTSANAYVKEASAQVTKGIADSRTPAAQQQDAAHLADAKAKQKLAQAAIATQSPVLDSARQQVAKDLAAQSHLGAGRGHLGIFRYSYYGFYESVLRPLEITAATSPENCIFPSQQTVTSGSYPLSYPLLITTTVQASKRADIRQYLLSYLGNAQRLATQQGLVELPDNVLSTEEAFFGAAEQQNVSTSAPTAGSTSAAGAGAPGAASAGLPPASH